MKKYKNIRSLQAAETILRKKAGSHQLLRTHFGSGRYGYSALLFGPEGSAIGSLDLVERPDGDFSLTIEPMTWIAEVFVEAGFPIHERKNSARRRREQKAQRYRTRANTKLKVTNLHVVGSP